MGWSYGRGTFKGRPRPIGYSVEAKCDHKGCKERIDRGLDFLCGNGLHGGELGCGGFFCYDHQKAIETPDDESVTLCPECAAIVIKAFRDDNGWDAEEGAPVENEDEAGRAPGGVG